MESGELQELFQEFPLRRLHERERVLAGDLPYAAQRYAHRAVSQGLEPGPWQVWMCIQEARGLSFSEALEELGSEQLFWLCQVLRRAGQIERSLDVYRHYLEGEARPGPSAYQNQVYLHHLLRLGRSQAALETVALIQSRFYDAVLETVFVAVRLHDENPEVSLSRLEPYLRKYHDCGDLWAGQALLLARCNRFQEAKAAVRECEILRCDDQRLLTEAREACKTPNPTDRPGLIETGNRSWALRPSRGGAHYYGGEPAFEMPACAGCGHPIRQWFCLDLSRLPQIHEFLPSWNRFPLLSCVDCVVWMGRHDYRLIGDRIVLSNLCFDARQARRMHVDQPDKHLRAISVDLFSDYNSERRNEPLVGGLVPWVQAPVGVPCLECREPMVYVAAMTTPARFNDVPFINNGNGYQFHFACDRCQTLSVIGQW